ncbi:MAG: WG repeat-containing protein, partial [Bacteroidota bacterium]
YSESLAPVKKNNFWGYISQKGSIVITPKYDKAEGFKNGIAKVKLAGREFYIDAKGREWRQL